MMESQNLVAEGSVSDRSQSIDDSAKIVGGPVAVVEAAADGGMKVELGNGVGEVVKRKRGRPPKGSRPQVQVQVQAKPPSAKKIKEKEEEEDVCFICFDGGSLVLCDRRGCPKAYHPACIKRDEAFFESAAKWNCGWHICSICQKTAHHMCYTCTYSLCRSCIRKADYVCVRGDKGFCTICMKTIMLIENNGQGEDGKVQADFDDKLSWEYLFKVYWVYLKGKLSLTLNELTQAKNPWKEAATKSSSAVQSAGVHNITNDLRSITAATATAIATSTSTATATATATATSTAETATATATATSTSAGYLDANEPKRRKIDEQIDMEKEKLENDESTTTVGCNEWATKELLEFVAHMKNGNTSVLSRVDVQALMNEYVQINNLNDPKKKNQIICDSRLKNLFGKSRVSLVQMLKLLEYHFVVKDDSQKSRVNRVNQVNRKAVHDDADWNPDNKKRRKKGEEERAQQNKLDEFAAVDFHNMNLVYLRRDLIENLLEDSENFHGKVVGSIVRIRISCSDQKLDMYRLVQVVGTSKVDVPYKIDRKLTDVMLEVLNLDKKETISIDTISDQEFSEEECRRLQQSIRCGLVKHFTVGEIQEKAVVLQSVKLNDWMEKEISRLNHLRDVASEKGHKKGYRECVEKLQLLKTPDERDRKLREIPVVHSDPKMNPDYESDDTEEYFNKEHGDHMESKYSRPPKKRAARSNDADNKEHGDHMESKCSRSPKKRAARLNDADNKSQIEKQKPVNQVEDGSCKSQKEEKQKPVNQIEDGLGKSQKHEADCNGSTSTKLDQPTTLSSSVSNNVPEPIASSSPDDMAWHYLDPNGNVQGPFSLVQLQRWSTTGYFPTDMKIWASQMDKSLLLNDVLKDKFGNQTESPNVAPNPVNYDSHGSSGQSFGQNWSANNNLKCNPMSNESNESTVLVNTSTEAEIKNAPTTFLDLPGPTPKKIESLLDSKVLIQDSGNPPSWSSASSLVVDGPKLPVSGTEWGGGGGSSNPIKREEWDSGLLFKPSDVAGDHVATPASNNIHQSINTSQPVNDDFQTWNGMGEMIEFSTLAEESVSDLLAEVDAMESQYGLPSPTSRRNSFVDDLFNGSFDDEFSPTPDPPGTRSDGSSSSGDIQLPCQPTATITTNDEQINAFDFMNKSAYPVGIPPRTNSDNTGFKWPEMERASQGMIDINCSAKAEGDEVEIETKTDNVQVKVKVENGPTAAPTDRGQNPQGEPMRAPKTLGSKLVNIVAQMRELEGTTNNHRRAQEEEEGEFIRPEVPQPLPPPPPPPLTLGLDPFDPPRDLGSETMQGKFNHVVGRNTGRSGNIDPNQRRYNSSSNSPRDTRSNRSSLNKQSSFGSSRGGSGGGGGYSRPPAKRQRVCRYYESGKCKKGGSCEYLHSSR